MLEGLGTEGVLALVVYTIIRDVVAPLVRKAKNNSPKLEIRNNPHPCAEHGERLATLEGCTRNIEKQLERVEKKLNGMK